MLFDTLKKEKMMAMKEKNTNKRTALEIVISKAMLMQIELKTQSKELTDSDVLGIISKTIKELSDEAEEFKKAGRAETVEELNAQKAALEAFLPKQLSKDEILNIINTLDDKSVPNVMKYFKANYNGQCDMKLVNEVARNQ